MNFTTISTTEVRDLARIFNYRKRKVTLVTTGRVTLSDLNWSGGSISRYTAIDLETGAMSGRDHSMVAPWDNRAEGVTVDIPENVAVIETGTFRGKPATMRIYVRPENVDGLKRLAAPLRT